MITNAAGAPLTKSALEAKTTVVTQPVVRELTEDVYQSVSTPGEAVFGGRRTLKYKAGQRVTQAAIDALYVAGTATAITPATALVAGGTKVTIRGTRLGGTTGVTIGGNAATAVKVLSESKLECVAPAHAAGAVAVSIANDDGTIAMAGTPLTYA